VSRKQREQGTSTSSLDSEPRFPWHVAVTPNNSILRKKKTGDVQRWKMEIRFGELGAHHDIE